MYLVHFLQITILQLRLQGNGPVTRPDLWSEYSRTSTLFQRPHIIFIPISHTILNNEGRAHYSGFNVQTGLTMSINKHRNALISLLSPAALNVDTTRVQRHAWLCFYL